MKAKFMALAFAHWGIIELALGDSGWRMAAAYVGFGLWVTIVAVREMP